MTPGVLAVVWLIGGVAVLCVGVRLLGDVLAVFWPEEDGHDPY